MKLSRPPALSPALAHLSDDALAERRRAAPADLKGAADQDAARALYANVVLPLEREAVWRAGRANPDADIDLLFVTVGTQADTPIHALLYWRAKYVVLLHTDRTEKVAQEAAAAFGLGFGQGTLVSVGKGTDPLRLYRAVKKTWDDRHQPTNTVIDLTGGYKAMSGAAAAVGFVIEGARVSYVETEQPVFHDKSFWLDTRVLLLDNPLAVFGEVERETARRLLADGRFAAAAQAWSELADQTRLAVDRWHAELSTGLQLQQSLRFHDAASALDTLLESIERESRRDHALTRHPLAQPRCRTWLDRRRTDLRAIGALVDAASKDTDPIRESQCLGAPAMTALIALLLGLGHHHASRGDGDLAALYAYRASEALVQQRLTLRGYDVQDFDWERAFGEAGVVPEQRPALLRKVLPHLPEAELATTAALPTKLDRGLGLSILGRLLRDPAFPDGVVKKLLGMSKARNRSILAHGVTHLPPKRAEALLRSSTDLFTTLHPKEDGDSGTLTHWLESLPPGLTTGT